jgi:fatty-acyl-CoA synthase
MTASPKPPTDQVLTPVDYLRRSEVIFSDRLAVVDGPVRLTYAQLADRARRQAGLLRGMGLRSGDRVAVLALNGRMLLEAHYGVAMAGSVLAALNTRLTGVELRTIVEHAGATILLYDPALADLAGELRVTNSLSSDEYEARLLSASPVDETTDDEYALIALNYTSGTTGRPKGVMYHHRGAFLQAAAMAYHGAITTSTVHLWTLPMFHCNGWAYTWAVTAGGGVHVCLPKVDPARIWQLIDDEGVTSLNGAPTVLIDLAAHPSAHVLSRVVDISTGGAPPSPTLLARLEALGFRVTHLYGLTETFGPSAICEFPADWSSRPGEERARLKARQGNANILGVPLRVVDDNERDVPADGSTMGEVVVRGNTVALGYYRDREATDAAFGTGWFHTGDLGVMHPDGYVQLTDRAKDIIISGGENIASIEVEQVLARHPAVLEVAVVAAPHERWGEVPHAYVATVADAAVTEAELITFARSQLPGFKTPKAIVFGPLPKTTTGKVQKFRLRELAAAAAIAQQNDA